MCISWIFLAVGLAAAGSPSRAETEAATPCDLAGSYRFRFRSNGHDGWWFRINVDGRLGGKPAKARLIEDVPVLGLSAGALAMTSDSARCKITLRSTGDAVGQLSLAIDLDAKANTFTGKLSRTKAPDAAEMDLAINGVRDGSDPPPSGSCIVPGIYRIAYDPRARWRNATKDDKRSCKKSAEWAKPVFARVEPFGKTLAISKRESEPPYKESRASDRTEQHDDCDVTMKISDSELTLEARLRFADDGVTGTAVEVTQQVYQDEGNIWDCVGKKIPLTVTRVPVVPDSQE